MVEVKKEKETPKNPVDPKEPVDPKDPKEPKTPKEPKEPVDPKDKTIQTITAQKEHFQKNDSKKAVELEKLKEDNLKLQGELDKKSSTLSESDLIRINPGYSDMSEEDKKEFRDKQEDKKRLLILEAKDKMRQEYAALPEDIRKDIEEKGGFEVFRDYACSPDNVGQKNLLNLAKSFLYEKETEPDPPVDPPVEETDLPGLEQPGGGDPIPSVDPNKVTMTAEQVETLRTRDPQRYAKLMKEKRLVIEG